MDRQQAMQHFLQTYATDEHHASITALDEYYQEKAPRLIADCGASFLCFCKNIRQAQQQGRKDKIAYIYCSFLYTSLQAGHVKYRFDAYDEHWFFDRQECMAVYDANWAFTFLYELGDKLKLACRKYFGLITKDDIDIILRQEAEKYAVYVDTVARAAVKEAVNSPEFAAIAKEELLQIYIGEYKDRCRTIYRHDSRPKNIAALRQQLKKKQQRTYPHEVWENLDFNGIDLGGGDLRYARLTGSSLHNTKLNNALLWGVAFTRTSIIDADFSHSELPGADFSHAHITGSQFTGVDGELCGLARDPYIGNIPAARFESATLSGVDFGEAWLTKTLFTGARLHKCSFCNTKMTDITFEKAVLTDCEFDNALLNTANFRRTELTNVNFQNADLTGADFRGAAFTDCEFALADLTSAIFLPETDLTGLHLTPEQEKSITLTGV